MRTLSIDAIQLDFQPPENLDEEKVREYVGRLLQGERIEPIIVRFDGTNYLLQDGFHRVEASRRVGLTEIEAEISPGTQSFEPPTVPAGFHAHAHLRSIAVKIAVELLGLLRIFQSPLARVSCFRVNKCDLLEARVVIQSL